MQDLSKEERWVLFNSGVNAIASEDFALNENDWRAKFNSRWHGSNSAKIVEAIAVLREKGLIGYPNNSVGPIRLTSSGIEQWELLAEPNFEGAYAWECQDPDKTGFDYRISIAACTHVRAIEVLCSLLNEGFFELVSCESIQIESGITFSSLYWHKANGHRLSCDVARADQSMDKLQKYAELCRPQARKWFRDFSETS